ncbi:hypothetical protein C8J57DRAFT_1488886 [Mycena rebaudengoi]|nr:hypothetical protein C8J57DRAFT_1488886 [Mycena rebaudengoi]
MPPPKMGTLEYEVPKVAILRSMARIGSFHRSPPKLCHAHPPPTPENNPLPLAPAKSSNPLSVAHICSTSQKAFLVPLELKPPDHSGDITQLRKNCLRFGFLSYLPTAHTATNCGSCASTASQHWPATAEQLRTHYTNTPAAALLPASAEH